ncbi:hypothetical protein JHL17_00560 [Azospirillum sp. YIM B02556]|uniref:Uncharacterized protein n=1 Tax=Azospirillum endophyticum TaxID=2800326 RepID=A0ABS1EXQ6_9PROT|nr:hypothetical protein [Azospirillum endophyticum]
MIAEMLAASRMGREDAEQGIAATLGPGRVGGGRAALQIRSSLAAMNGPAQMIADSGATTLSP